MTPEKRHKVGAAAGSREGLSRFRGTPGKPEHPLTEALGKGIAKARRAKVSRPHNMELRGECHVIVPVTVRDPRTLRGKTISRRISSGTPGSPLLRPCRHPLVRLVFRLSKRSGLHDPAQIRIPDRDGILCLRNELLEGRVSDPILLVEVPVLGRSFDPRGGLGCPARSYPGRRWR